MAKNFNECAPMLRQQCTIRGEWNSGDLMKLKKNTRCNYVVIKGTTNNANKVKSRDVASLMKTLRGTKVKYLHFCNTKLNSTGVKHLANGLINTKITHLHLINTQIDSAGIKYLAATLKDTSLISLSMPWNIIKDKGMKYLAEGLKNTNIIKLNVGANGIGPKGIKLLADVLKDTNITFLHLTCSIDNGSPNEIDHKAAKYLLNHLKDSCVTYLHLGIYIIWGYLNAGWIATALKDTKITRLFFKQEKKLQYVEELSEVTSKNKKLAKKIQRLFKKFVVQCKHNDELEFAIPSDARHLNFGEYLDFIKILTDAPNVKGHIFEIINNMFLCVFSNIIASINVFAKTLCHKFNTFFQNNLPELVNLLGDGYDYVDLVKQCEDMQLPDIVEALLLHRELYYVDDGHEILHPFIYKMLNKYDMPLYIEQIEPNKREDIISYFENHTEIDGAQEIIDLLKSDCLQLHKRRKTQ